LWLRGLADEAVRTAQKAIDEAESRHHHPVALSYALAYGSSVFIWTGDWQRAVNLVERLIAYSRQHSLDPHHAVGMALKGELAVLNDDAKAGVNLLRTALEALGAIRHNLYSTGYMAALADGLRKSGDLEGAQSVINGAIARADSSGEGIYLPELLRTKAQILVSLPRPDRDTATDCLKRALLVAREQSALAWELRSATTLAVLLAEAGQRSEGRQVIAGVYDRFVEGFETIDLRTARQIIRDLL
jgi:predicted ATPase